MRLSSFRLYLRYSIATVLTVEVGMSSYFEIPACFHLALVPKPQIIP
jgi:hypothetical protein